MDGGERFCGPTSWSPDGDLLTCIALPQDLFVFSIASGQSQQFPTTLAWNAWLPDGRRLVVSNADDALEVLDVRTKLRKQLLHIPNVAAVDASVSRDGRTIFFVKAREAGDVFVATSIDSAKNTPH